MGRGQGYEPVMSTAKRVSGGGGTRSKRENTRFSRGRAAEVRTADVIVPNLLAKENTGEFSERKDSGIASGLVLAALRKTGWKIGDAAKHEAREPFPVKDLFSARMLPTFLPPF